MGRRYREMLAIFRFPKTGAIVAFVWDKASTSHPFTFTTEYRNVGYGQPTIDGQDLTGRARRTSISRDGNIVAFHSTAGNLDSQDTTFFDDVSISIERHGN